MEKTYIVAYTDGASKNNPGKTGYGIHMYIGTPGKEVINSSYLYTNLGYVKKHDIRPDMVVLKTDRIIDIYGSSSEINTSNRAELLAVITLLETLISPTIDIISDISDTIDLLILSDSTYVLEILQHLTVGNDNKYVANLDLIERLRSAIDRASKRFNIAYDKVEAHSGDLGNDRADLLANIGVRYFGIKNTPTVVVSNHAEYYNTKRPKTPIDIGKYIFVSKLLNNNAIYMLHYSDLDDLGKRDIDVIYTVLLIDEKLKIIRYLEDTMATIMKTINIPYVIDIKNSLDKHVYTNYMLYGSDYLIVDQRNKKISTVDGILLAKVIYPPTLFVKVEDIFLHSTNVLVSFIDNNISTIDITDRLFETRNGKTLLKQNLENFSVSIDNVKINISVNTDLPSQNILKSLHGDVNIYLAYENSELILTYYIVLAYGNTDNKNYILLNPFYTNKIIKTHRSKK